jgi:hypothetical protein
MRYGSGRGCARQRKDEESGLVVPTKGSYRDGVSLAKVEARSGEVLRRRARQMVGRRSERRGYGGRRNVCISKGRRQKRSRVQEYVEGARRGPRRNEIEMAKRTEGSPVEATKENTAVRLDSGAPERLRAAGIRRSIDDNQGLA